MNVFNILKKRPEDSNKGTFGKVLTICGSRCFQGAVALSALGALRSGAGLVCVATIDRVIHSLASRILEGTFLPLEESESGTIAIQNKEILLKNASSATACLIGCGLGRSTDITQLLAALIPEISCSLVLDADALNTISENLPLLDEAKKTPIITPHIGEMARLCGKSIPEIKENPMQIALAFAKNHACIVVLKDHVTLVCTPTGETYQNTTGNAGLARGGSGDILAGIITSFVAQGIAPYDAAVCGVFLHGLAADRCAARLSQYGMLPSDILTDLCAIFLENDR